MRGDCDDADGAVHPGVPDFCDAAGRDDDCNGVPNDPTGGCDCTIGEAQVCPDAQGACATGAGGVRGWQAARANAARSVLVLKVIGRG